MQIVFAEWVISIITLVVSVVFFVKTFTFPFPDVPCDPGGMGLFPRWVSIITGVASLFLMVRLIRNRSPGIPGPIEPIRRFFRSWKKGSTDEQSILARRITYVFIFSTGYPWFIVRAGFFLSTLAYVFVLMKVFRTKTLISAIISFIITFTIYFFFLKILEAYVPPGVWVESILESILD